MDVVVSEREKIVRSLAQQREALRLRPNDLALLNNTAWTLATSPNASVRNGVEAVALAERAAKLSAGNDPAVLDTLAAAYAEARRFAEAAATAESPGTGHPTAETPLGRGLASAIRCSMKAESLGARCPRLLRPLRRDRKSLPPGFLRTVTSSILGRMIEVFEYCHTVTKDEIDALGHTNNVEYVRWFQDAATAHSASRGWTPERYPALGLGWVAKSHTIEYIRPSFAKDKIVVRTSITSRRRVAYTRSYLIVRCSDGELLARGETIWAFVDYATGKPARIPPGIEDAFPDSSKWGKVA